MSNVVYYIYTTTIQYRALALSVPGRSSVRWETTKERKTSILVARSACIVVRNLRGQRLQAILFRENLLQKVQEGCHGSRQEEFEAIARGCDVEDLFDGRGCLAGE